MEKGRRVFDRKVTGERKRRAGGREGDRSKNAVRIIGKCESEYSGNARRVAL